MAIGASGGKDSAVLAKVLQVLNERHNYGLELYLLSIDEGISGYRDHSLDEVKYHANTFGLQLKILSYKGQFSIWLSVYFHDFYINFSTVQWSVGFLETIKL